MASRSPPRRARSTACVCSACGRIVDATEEVCSKCGEARPSVGWAPLGMPRPAEEEPVLNDDFNFVPETIDTSNLISLRGITPTRLEVATLPPDDGEPVNGWPSPTPPASRRRPEPLRVRIGPPKEYAPPPDDPTTDEEGQYAGRYRLEEALPAAPGTRRHLAVQEPAVRRVHLTILSLGRPADVQEGLESRFLRDARVLARLRHPCLASVHDAGRASDGTCYFTEEVPFGATFLDLASAGALPPERLLPVAANLAAALAAAHEAGVVHRCLRGDAVIVAPGVWRGAAGGEMVHVGRFGLHLLPEEIASEDDPQSALAWPPEVLAGEEPDEAGDIYAIGVLLYHALVGAPLHAGTADQIRAAVAARAPVRLPRGGERLGSRLRVVAKRCLAPSAEHRYPSMRALLRDLEELAKPQPIAPVVVASGLSYRAAAAAALVGAIVPSLVLAAFLLRESEPPASETRPEPAAPSVAPVAPVAPLAAPEAPPVAPAAQPVAAPAPPPAAPAAVSETPSPVSLAAARRRAAATTAASSASVPAASPPAAPVAPAAPAPEPARASEPSPTPVAVAVAAPTPPPASPPAEIAPARATIPGASALSGLWLGKAPGGALALDLIVSADGRVTGRARRGDRAGEAAVVGRVNTSEDGLRLELQITDDAGTESYSGLVADGAVSGRITAEGRLAGRFSVKR
jgi:hypothetical protein